MKLLVSKLQEEEPIAELDQKDALTRDGAFASNSHNRHQSSDRSVNHNRYDRTAPNHVLLRIYKGNEYEASVSQTQDIISRHEHILN